VATVQKYSVLWNTNPKTLALTLRGSWRGKRRATDIDTELSGTSLDPTAMCGQESESDTFCLLINVATFHRRD
jgi:hypothetical protein